MMTDADQASATDRIDAIASLVIPVTDQDRALRFYRNVLGLRVIRDTETGPGFRWIEVAPHDSAVTIALIQPRGNMWGTVGVDTRIVLHSNVIDRFHALLRADHHDVDEVVLRLGPPVPPMFRLRDPDMNEIQITG